MDGIYLQLVHPELCHAFSSNLVLLSPIPVEMPVGEVFGELIVVGAGLFDDDAVGSEAVVVKWPGGGGAAGLLGVEDDVLEE